MRRLNFLFLKSAICLGIFVFASMVSVQVAHSCEISAAEGKPQLQIIECAGAVTIERERAAELRITKRPSDKAPSVIQVNGGAILINVSPSNAPTQVRTPHAIATVRGTTYIVDAGAERTSVFVLEGGVDVRSTAAASTVALNAGEGTDVAFEGSLSVQKWDAARTDALLARFGR